MQEQFDNFFNELRILHLALVVGVVLISLIILFFLGAERQEEQSFIPLIGPLIAVASLTFMYFNSAKKMKQIKDIEDLDDKLMAYRTLQVQKYSLLEGPALINILFYYLYGDYMLILVASGLIFLLVLLLPLKDKIKYDLGLQ